MDTIRMKALGNWLLVLTLRETLCNLCRLRIQQGNETSVTMYQTACYKKIITSGNLI